MKTSAYTIDLGSGPWGEDCAQIGHTPNFDHANRAELEIYKAALIAHYGPPPPGISFDLRSNPHDFGTYQTLEASIDHTQDDGAQRPYLDHIEAGIERWHHAGFSCPEIDQLRTATDVADAIETAIRGAINTTRPLPSGEYFPPEFRGLNEHLKAAFPSIASTAIA